MAKTDFVLVRLSQREETTHAKGEVILHLFTCVVLISGMFGLKHFVTTRMRQTEFATYLTYHHLIVHANCVKNEVDTKTTK